jgi:hypothetical protein
VSARSPSLILGAGEDNDGRLPLIADVGQLSGRSRTEAVMSLVALYAYRRQGLCTVRDQFQVESRSATIPTLEQRLCGVLPRPARGVR